MMSEQLIKDPAVQEEVQIQKDQIQIKQSQEIVEIVDTKPQNIISNKSEILKIFQNMNDEDEAPHLAQPVFKSKRSSLLKKKQSQSKQTRKKQKTQKQVIQQKKQRIFKAIQPLLKKYKATNAPNVHDSQLNKTKYQGKQKIFKFILYNIHQLKDEDYKSLCEEEQSICDYNGTDAYNFAKNIANQISAYFISYLNHNSRNSITKKFKSQWKKLISNIQDQNNFEFRTKISRKIWTPQKLADADQIQFYPKSKRQLIIQRNKRLINASTVQEKFLQPIQQELIQNYDSKTYDIGIKMPQQKQTKKTKLYSHLQQTSITMIRQFLSDDHIQKMKGMIEKDIKHKDILLTNIEKVFKQ